MKQQSKADKERKAREKQIFVDDGQQIGKVPVDDRIYLDDGARIGLPPQPKPKKT